MSEKNILTELAPIFHPRSVALIGASSKQGKVGRLFMDRFVETGFQKFYPVNPREKEILGVPVYHAVTDIPGPVDLAIVLTPPKSVLASVKECVAKGVKGIVITTAGFGELGEKGKEVEQEMVRIAHEGGARIIGPNCVGIYSPEAKLPFPLGPSMKKGPVGVVSQSGSFGDFLTLIAANNGVHFSRAISCGNECDLNATDFLEYLGEDPATKLIMIYLEGIKDGRRFYDLAKKISKKKPIILWRCGLTEFGARAATSHTGALAGSRPVWEGALRQAGIIRVKSFEEALDCLYAFYFQPPPKGPRIAIISGAGGLAVGAADACLEFGLEMARPSKETLDKLNEVVASVGTSVNNPFDLSIATLVAPNVYGDAIRILGQEKDVDMILVISILEGNRVKAQKIIGEAMKDIQKPLAIACMGQEEMVVQSTRQLRASGIPAYSDPMKAVKAMARALDYAQFRQRFWEAR